MDKERERAVSITISQVIKELTGRGGTWNTRGGYRSEIRMLGICSPKPRRFFERFAKEYRTEQLNNLSMQHLHRSATVSHHHGCITSSSVLSDGKWTSGRCWQSCTWLNSFRVIVHLWKFKYPNKILIGFHFHLFPRDTSVSVSNYLWIVSILLYSYFTHMQ